MTEPNRPHCRAAGDCQAKSEKHCRPCSAAHLNKQLWADPAFRQKHSKRMADLNRDPAVNARQAAGWKKNKAGVAKVRRIARAKMVGLRADPEVAARRDASIAASLPKRRRENATRLAKQHGFPVCLVTEFRAMTRKNIPAREAVSALRSSFPEDFADVDQVARVTGLRDLGPIPAIGMPGRAEWTRRANAVVGARG